MIDIQNRWRPVYGSDGGGGGGGSGDDGMDAYAEASMDLLGPGQELDIIGGLDQGMAGSAGSGPGGVASDGGADSGIGFDPGRFGGEDPLSLDTPNNNVANRFGDLPGALTLDNPMAWALLRAAPSDQDINARMARMKLIGAPEGASDFSQRFGWLTPEQSALRQGYMTTPKELAFQERTGFLPTSFEDRFQELGAFGPSGPQGYQGQEAQLSLPPEGAFDARMGQWNAAFNPMFADPRANTPNMSMSPPRSDFPGRFSGPDMTLSNWFGAPGNPTPSIPPGGPPGMVPGQPGQFAAPDQQRGAPWFPGTPAPQLGPGETPGQPTQMAQALGWNNAGNGQYDYDGRRFAFDPDGMMREQMLQGQPYVV